MVGEGEDWWCFPLSDVGSLKVARHQHAASSQITIGSKKEAALG